jgi:hypothetical protein
MSDLHRLFIDAKIQTTIAVPHPNEPQIKRISCLHHSSGDSAYPLIRELRKQKPGISKPQSIVLKKKNKA